MIASASHPAVITLPEPLEHGLQTYIANGKLRLPMLPDVVLEVLHLCESSDGDAQKIAEILHRDPTLAGNVLRVANSPLYKPRTPITSLQQAISRLGLKILTEMVYTVTLQNRAFKIEGYDQEVKALWQHSVSTAFYTKELARLQGYNVDKAFLWGLLHDVGKAAVLLALTQLQGDVADVFETSVTAAAMDRFHVEVGGLIAERWALPAMVRECILYHHDYRAAPTCQEAAMVTCLADRLSYAAMRQELDLSELESLRRHEVFADLRLSPEQFDGLVAKFDEVTQVMAALTMP